MHKWFFISLVAPVLWTIVTHIDKYLLSKRFKGNGVGAIFLFSSLFSFFVLIGILLYDHSVVLNLGVRDIATLLSIGIFSAIAFFLYLRALDIEESSVVIPLLQLIPVFAYFLSYFILGETLNKTQILAALIVILGIVVLSIEFDSENKVKLRKKVLYLIAGSSFLFALHDVVFKSVAVKDTFISSTFWQYAGLCIAGVVVFALSPKYRAQLKSIFQIKDGSVLSLNITSEVLYIIGNLASNFATLLAPVALVLVVTSYQPLFVFIGGTLLTLFLPQIATEKIRMRNLFQKLVSIAIILIGSYLLYSSS
jgi:uncharacterized membrane protein